MEINAAFNGNTTALIIERRVEVDGISYVDFETIPFEKREYIFSHVEFQEWYILSRKRPVGCGNEYLIKETIFNRLTQGYGGNSNT